MQRIQWHLVVKRIWRVSVSIVSFTRFKVNLLCVVVCVIVFFCSKRRDIWSWSDCNGILTQNHLVRKRSLNHLSKLVKMNLAKMVECVLTRAGEINFKGEGPWNSKSVVDNHGWPIKKFWILHTLEWLKQYNFDLGDRLLIVSALKLFPFFLCVLFFFSFATMQVMPPPPTPQFHPPWPLRTRCLWVQIALQYLRRLLQRFYLASIPVETLEWIKIS